MLTQREAFKFAFMARCIEEGITDPAEMQKVAAATIYKLQGTQKQAIIDIPGKVIDTAKDWGGKLLSLGIPLALAAPPILGAGAGYAMSRATDIDDHDVEEVKRQELIDELRRQSAKAKRNQAARTYSQQRKQTGRIFM